MESLILSLAAALASIVVTGLLVDVALRILPDTFPRRSEITVDFGIWVFAVLASIGSGLLVVLSEIGRLPEVSLVAAGSTIPMGPISTRVDPEIGYTYRGQPPLRAGEESRVAVRTVTDDYFRVLDVGLVAGRFFDGREVASENLTMIVNQSLADAIWPGENPIGRELILQQRGGDRAFTIVGVVENYRFEGLRADIKLEVFLSMSQVVFGGASFLTKIRSDNPEAAMQAIAGIASRLDSSMPMIEVHAMEELVVDSVAEQQAVLVILLGFALFATLLAAVGI